MALTPRPSGRQTGGQRRAAFEPGPERTPFYRFARRVVHELVVAVFRPRVEGRANVPQSGAVIIAPVHRSFADFAFAGTLTDRKLFFMAKDELWRNRWFGRLLEVLGVFPVHREAADREALRYAEAVLRQGQALVMFPEGTRKQGAQVAELLEGAAFLAARTGASVVPVGIGNSDRAMPKGSLVPKPLRIRVVAGPAMAPPARSEGGRVSRSRVHAATEELHRRIQDAYDLARG